jgi:hypothetical protein
MIADLKHGAAPARASAVHETEMAAMSAGQNLDHGRGFAVGADGENHTFIGPVHGPSL